MTDLRHVSTIGRTELRRRWRVVRENPAQLVAIAFMALFALPMVAIVGFGGFLFGRSISDGAATTTVTLTRTGLVYLWLLAVGFGGLRAYSTALRPDHLDGLLTTVSHRELICGLLFAEAVVVGVPTLLLAGLGGVSFAVGAGSPIAAPLTVATVLCVLSTALLVGFLLAIVVRNMGVRSKLLTRLRTLLFVLLGVAYFWLVFTESFDTVLAPLYRLLEPTPVGWFGDLLLVGTVPGASLGRSIGTVLASGGLLLVGSAAIARLAALLWYADGVHIEHEAAPTNGSTLDTRLGAVLPQPIAGVVAVDYRRARRAPVSLSFVLYPLFLLVNPIMTTVQTGSVDGALPLWIVLCGAWITGAVFPLNVVATEGAVLPATLLGSDPGRALVGGHVVAAALVGVPVTVLATAGLAVASPRPLPAVATLSASALVLAAAAGPIASGIGAAFPRFQAVRLSRSTRAIVPSMVAFAIFSTVIVIVALSALVGHSGIVGHAFESWFGIAQPTVALAGTLLTTVLAVPTGALSALYAVRAVDSFRFE